MPFDRTRKFYHTNKDDDCFRVAVACVLNEHPRNVKYHSPGDSHSPFWDDWTNYLYDKYNRYLTFWDGALEEWWRGRPQHNIEELIELDRDWIAIVPCFYRKNGSHAINMKGSKFVGDFTGIRKQKPKKILYGVTLDPVK